MLQATAQVRSLPRSPLALLAGVRAPGAPARPAWRHATRGLQGGNPHPLTPHVFLPLPPPHAAWAAGGQQSKFSNGVVGAVLFIPLVIT